MLLVAIVAVAQIVTTPGRTYGPQKFPRSGVYRKSTTTHRIAPGLVAVLAITAGRPGPAVKVRSLLVDDRVRIVERVGPLAGYSHRDGV